VDKVILLNGIDGVFPVKEIASQIVKAVQPVELRRRVEYELSTIAGKELTRDLVELYNFLVAKYTAWYELFPSGFINNPTGVKGGATRPGASNRKIKCFNCQGIGHRAAECTAAKKERNGGAEAGSPVKAAGRKCFKCGQVGHMKTNCPSLTKAVDKTAKGEGNGGGAASKSV